MKSRTLSIMYNENGEHEEGSGLVQRNFSSGVVFTDNYEDNQRVFNWLCNAARLTLQQQGVLQ